MVWITTPLNISAVDIKKAPGTTPGQSTKPLNLPAPGNPETDIILNLLI